MTRERIFPNLSGSSDKNKTFLWCFLLVLSYCQNEVILRFDLHLLSWLLVCRIPHRWYSLLFYALESCFFFFSTNFLHFCPVCPICLVLPDFSTCPPGESVPDFPFAPNLTHFFFKRSSFTFKLLVKFLINFSPAHFLSSLLLPSSCLCSVHKSQELYLSFCCGFEG